MRAANRRKPRLSERQMSRTASTSDANVSAITSKGVNNDSVAPDAEEPAQTPIPRACSSTRALFARATRHQLTPSSRATAHTRVIGRNRFIHRGGQLASIIGITSEANFRWLTVLVEDEI